jgi:hypothetical protein
MATIEVRIDTRTERALSQLAGRQGQPVPEVASRLLARAARASRPRPVYDLAAIQAHCSDHADEDSQLAEAASEERAELLRSEDVD